MSIRDSKGNLQARHAFPAYRVFIYGVNVTEDVLSVEVSYNVGRAPNTCTITLANELDKYILTTPEFTTLFGDVSLVKQAIQKRIKEYLDSGVDKNDETDLGAAATSDIDDLILKKIKQLNNDIKKRVLASKFNIRTEVIEIPDIAGKLGGENVRQYSARAYKYPFQAEDPIFHANDPIRIFMRDPYNPRKWYHQFSGYLSNFDDTVDENNQRILTVTGEGPFKLLRYARVTTNPAVLDRAAIIKSKDLDFRAALSEGFSGLTLPELFFTIIFGNDPSEEGKFTLTDTSPNASQVRTMNIDAVGKFRINGSVVVEFGPDRNDPLILSNIPTANVTSLAEYQSLIDHEVKETDLDDMLTENADGNIPADAESKKEALKGRARIDPNTNNIIAEDVINIIGENTDIYPIDGGRLIMLVPRSFQADVNREVLLKDFLDTFALNTTQFKSRLGIMLDVVERIEFVFYESPKGDLICEFPLYDFDPDDFGSDATVPHKFMKGRNSLTLDQETKVQRGPFRNKYTTTKRNTYNFSKGITDEKVRTQVTSYYHPLQGHKKPGTSREYAAPQEVTLEHLIPLYWYRLEQVPPKAYIATNEAAKLYAHLTLNKMNADARTLGINAAPNLGAWLNRPFYFEPRNCIGTLMSVSHSITWGMGGTMDTRLNLNYIRGWDGLLDDQGNAVYTTIGGFPGRPLNYKLLFRLKDDVDGASELPAIESSIVTEGVG